MAAFFCTAQKFGKIRRMLRIVVARKLIAVLYENVRTPDKDQPSRQHALIFPPA